MRKENFLYKLNKTFETINSNKRLFFTQTFITLIFILALTFVIYKYSLEAIGHQQEVFSYIESIDINDPLNSPLGDDPLAIYQSIKAAKNAMINLFLFCALAAFIFGYINWFITKLMTNKKYKENYFFSFPTVFLAYLIPLGLYFYFSIKVSITQALSENSMFATNMISWIVLALIFYLYYISISLTTNTPLKQIPKKTLLNAKKLLITIPAYLLSLILVLTFTFLTGLFAEGNILLLFFFITLLLASITYNRILLATCFD